MKILLISIGIFYFGVSCFGQLPRMNSAKLKAIQAKTDSLSKFDYLSMNYKYLDSEHRIKVDSIIFSNAVAKYKYKSERIRRYKDSLGVVLMLEFDDWHQARIAENRISFSWLRLSYHTWQSEKEAQEFAAQFEMTHPWRMREFLIDEANHHREIKKFYKQLLKKVEKETGRADLDTLSREEFLNVAMRNNPQRIRDFRKLQQEVRKKREEYRKEHSAKEETQID